MYICSCHAVTDGAIRECAQSGIRTFRGVVKKTKVGSQCGICALSAKEIFDQAKRESRAAPQTQTPVPTATEASDTTGKG
ncbi:MAG TPA: (2Fe-2S)-binding protein [Candidatus Obscuribacterales bacterium]